MNDFTKYNFHTHTYRCKHASGTEREYIESAIRSGIKILGFADHVPCPFKEKGRVSGIRMDMAQAPEYVCTLKKLKEEYKKDIDIYIGFEAEYIPEFYPEQVEMCRQLDCDYMIMGPHFLSGEPGVLYTGVETRDTERLKAYVDSVLEGAATGHFMYIAHPDLINFTGEEKVYRSHIRRLCEGLKELDVPVEINVVGMAGNRHYPTPLFWKIAGQTGIPAVAGLDAHSIRDMENREAYGRCLELLDKNNVRLITEPEHMLWYMNRTKNVLQLDENV